MTALLRKLISWFSLFVVGMAYIYAVHLSSNLDKQLKFQSETYKHSVQALNLPEGMASSDSIKRGMPSINETDNTKLPVKQEPVLEQHGIVEQQQPNEKSAVKQEPVCS